MSGILQTLFMPSGIGGNDSNTVVLLHMDGTNGSTTFTNSAAGGSTAFTAGGNAQISTTSPKFGTGSGLFDGAADYVSFDGSGTDFSLSGDFTIDFWLKTSVVTQDGAINRRLLSMGVATSYAVWVTTGGIVEPVNEDVASLHAGSTNLANGAWHHWAWVRSGSTNYVFADGVQEGTTFSNSVSWVGKTTAKIGCYYNGTVGAFNGNIDEFRISKGIARWTANFTPPTGPYA